MKIRNQTELKLFEETLDNCTSSVLLVTQQGEQYDLSDPSPGYTGKEKRITFSSRSTCRRSGFGPAAFCPGPAVQFPRLFVYNDFRHYTSGGFL